MCLGLLLKRSLIEVTFQTIPALSISNRLQNQIVRREIRRNDFLLKWASSQKIDAYLSAEEYELLHKPVGRWDNDTILRMSWQVEPLGMLLWALGYVEQVPEFVSMFDTELVMKPLDLGTPIVDFIWCAQLRPMEQLVRTMECAELWVWRGRARELEQLGIRPSNGSSFRDIVATRTRQATETGHLSASLCDDFAVFDTPYSDLDRSTFMYVRAIAQKRYQTLTWLMTVNECADPSGIEY